MRLKHIVMINRAPFSHLELDLGDENISVLSGINGAGKTTIISYVVDAFYELAKKGFLNEFEKTSTKYYRISSGLFSLDSAKVSVVYLRFLQTDGSYADYIDVRGDCNQQDYDSMILMQNKIEYSKIEHTLKNGGVVKYWTISDRKTIGDLFSSNLLTYFPAYRYETPYYLNDPYKIHLEFSKDMDFSGYLPNPIEVTSDLPEIANWVMDIVLDQQLYAGKALSVFSELNTIISAILINKTSCITCVGIGQRFSGANRIAIMDRDIEGKVVYPSIFIMSSGELALLCLFVELLRQTDKNRKQISNVSGIVLVDEIDKHLHIKLQKDVLPALIALFPNVQFIASSHSPFLGLGLAEFNNSTYSIYDLDNDGIPCPPQDSELFKEVYRMMISENDRYAAKYKALQQQTRNNTRPLVITEGKTDWKHIKAAMRALDISDLDFDFYEYEDTLGDTTLLQLLKNYARIQQQQRIIGVFDRDNFASLKCKELESQEFVSFQNNVYAFAIPVANEDVYGSEISIEHYYKTSDLTKSDENGRRLFLGSEFYPSGISQNQQYHTRIKQINNKVKNNGIIDEKVYELNSDPEEKNSIALSKNDFADLMLSSESFFTGVNFSEFTKIFDVIRRILNDGIRNQSDV